jgi:hypothetical protein
VPPDPIRIAASGIDLSGRFVESVAVVASPAAAAETIIAQTAALPEEVLVSGVLLSGWAAFTVGTNGTAARLRLRQTNVAGAIVADTGALTGGIAAAGLVALGVQGKDSSPAAAGQVYVLTLQVTAGSAPSTVSATSLRAIAV